MASLATGVLVWGLIGLPGLACTFDPSNRCGDHEVVYGDNARCICAAGYALSGHECVACGEHEVAGPTSCVCADGYARPSATSGCVLTPTGLGAVCDAQSAPCTAGTFGYCAVTSGTAGYCTTSGCAADTDCAGGYACDTSGTPAFCRRPPVGAGIACQSSTDCAGTEATYCDTAVSHVCLVEKCTLTPNNCFIGTACCDLSSFGVPNPVCLPQGACPT